MHRNVMQGWKDGKEIKLLLVLQGYLRERTRSCRGGSNRSKVTDFSDTQDSGCRV